MIEIKNLKVHFRHNHRTVNAVDGVDFFLTQGITTSLAGESGCGKTTLARAILGFYKPKAGSITLNKIDITQKRHEGYLRKNVQIVFQNPYSSVDPRYTVQKTLHEALTVFQKVSPANARELIVDSLSQVELGEEVMNRYPHQLSGGQVQRVCIARALINRPPVIILDEPTSSLDIVTSTKVIDLLARLQKQHNLTFLFISHNLKLLKKIAHFSFIMYCGKIVEYAAKEVLYSNPLHPYTKLLLDASYQRLSQINEGLSVQEGCPFISRCPVHKADCANVPALREIEPGHFVACHYI